MSGCPLRVMGGEQVRRAVDFALRKAPSFDGKTLRLRIRPLLFAYRGKLRFREGPGEAVHAASFIRERRMVLESLLLEKRAEFRRVLLHELAHFAWVRLGNPRREQWGEMVARECALGLAGECGWSAELRKEGLGEADRRNRSRRWRDYVCESFCDTAAWVWGGCPKGGEVTLNRRALAHRRKTLMKLTGTDCIPI